MGISRCLAVLIVALGSLPAAAQTEPQELLHYEFNPPLDTEIVYAIEILSTLVTPEVEHIERWTQEVVLVLDEKQDEELVGTVELRNVVNVENAGNDLYYLVAKAVEGQTYDVKLFDFGMAAEIDWPAVEARLGERLPALTDHAGTDLKLKSLDLFTDKTKVLLRPFDAMGQSYVFPFRTDGDLHQLDGAGGLTWFALDPARIEIAGGFDGEANAHILDWLVTPEPQAATDLLAETLRSLAVMIDDELGEDSSSLIEAAIEAGLTAAEDGYAVYDLDKGLITEATITALIASDPLAHGTRITATLAAP